MGGPSRHSRGDRPASDSHPASTLPCAKEPSQPPPPCPQSVPSRPSCRGRSRRPDCCLHGPGLSGPFAPTEDRRFADHVFPCLRRKRQGRSPCPCISIDSRSAACRQLHRDGKECCTRAPPAATPRGRPVRWLRSHLHLPLH